MKAAKSALLRIVLNHVFALTGIALSVKKIVAMVCADLCPTQTKKFVFVKMERILQAVDWCILLPVINQHTVAFFGRNQQPEHRQVCRTAFVIG